MNGFTIIGLIAAMFCLSLLGGCSLIEASFPNQSDKVVQLSQKGIKQYCERVPLTERVTIRQRLNTPDTGVVVWCNDYEVLDLQNYLRVLAEEEKVE